MNGRFRRKIERKKMHAVRLEQIKAMNVAIEKIEAFTQEALTYIAANPGVNPFKVEDQP